MPGEALKLPLRFSPARLKEDLDRVPAAAWVPHFNDRYYEGDWSGVALRAVGGVAGRIYPDPSVDAAYADTHVLSLCPYFGEVLDAFRCPIGSARLLRLGPGSRIREHADLDLDAGAGTVRLHVPVVTSPLVEFVVAGRAIAMAEGETWYFNASLPHRVDNRGLVDRVHLVLDCRVDEWLRDLLRSGHDAPVAVVENGLDEFRCRVLADPSLQARLRGGRDRAEFARRVVQLGREHGYGFTVEDVASALERSRRAWRDRGWV